MSEKRLLILERSSQNLKKISKDGRTVLEGVFAEFGIENRNGRVYEEREYLPHLDYLQKDIKNKNLLGELDHPERFEVSLGNVSHRITELWYDQGKRQILGRIEILDGTPKGQIAKSLLEAGVPLSISSRAAGSVNEDKTVAIQQIYTYDLVAKPGFESAQLHAVNEGETDPAKARLATLLENFNDSFQKQEKDSINAELGIINENISIFDVTDKFPSVQLREEAKSLIQKNNETMKTTNDVMPDVILQEWTSQHNQTISDLSKRLDNIENAILENNGTLNVSADIKNIKGYIEKFRKIQEGAINWQEDIAKNVNKIGNYANTLAKKSNKHYQLTKKIVETVDHNAKTLNHTQDWVGNNAQVTNAIGNTIDHNAVMLNGINEWNSDLAKSVNKLNEWGEEKAVAINGMHEWTSSIAKNLNRSAEYNNDMFGRSLSKHEGRKLIEYIEFISEGKKYPKLKKAINEMLNKHSITANNLNEAKLKSLDVLDADHIGKAGNNAVGGVKTLDSVQQFADVGKVQGENKSTNFKKGSIPKELDTLDDQKQTKIVIGSNGKKYFVLDAAKTIGKGKEAVKGNGPTPKHVKDQDLKLNQTPSGKLKEEENIDRTLSIKTRSSKLDERLDKIVKSLEKERELDETTKSQYPFTTLLSESDRRKFNDLSLSDKQKVTANVEKVPTIESEIILKLWESALTNNVSETKEPLWLELAPKNLKAIYEKYSNSDKEVIKAKSEFFQLDTQYQINNFWELSGIVEQTTVTLNEGVVAAAKHTINELDPLVAAVGKQMKTYDNR